MTLEQVDELIKWLREKNMSSVQKMKLMNIDNSEKTLKLMETNPKMSKQEILKIMEIKEDEY